MPSSLRVLRRVRESGRSHVERVAPSDPALSETDPTELFDRYWYLWIGGLVAAVAAAGIVREVTGDPPEMVVETLFVPLLGTEDGGNVAPVERVVDGLGIALPVVLLGLYGLLASLWADHETRRTVAPSRPSRRGCSSRSCSSTTIRGTTSSRFSR
jgi:hypothetical protein